MPCVSFQYDPRVGPVSQVGIWPPKFRPTLGPTSATSMKFYNALFDTGASCTCISAQVISDLTLSPSGKQAVGGVHGSQATNEYQFQVVMAFPNTSPGPGGVVQANAIVRLVTGVEFIPPPGYDVLLGRDIICGGTFSLGFDNRAVFCL